MTWHALTTMKPRNVAEDLSASHVPCFVPKYTVTHWDGRRSVRVSREHLLLGNYILVGSPALPVGVTRHRVSYLRGPDGPLPLRDSVVQELRARCEAGEFDVDQAQQCDLSEGTRVEVVALGLVGTILRQVRRLYFSVMLDAGREVGAPSSGLLAV